MYGVLLAGKTVSLCALLLFSSLVGARSAAESRARSSSEAWREVRSPHFVVVTDGRTSQAQDVAAHFERIRELFLKLSPRLQVDTPRPVVILAVKDEQDLSTLLPGYWEQKGHSHPSGIFVSGEDRNFIALRLNVDRDQGYHILYHEYVHLLETLNFSSLPLWVSEGLAEFYASARIGGKDAGVGYPIPADMALLRAGKWIPLETLLTADASSPLYNENDVTSIFYAESWELTHFLLTSNQGASQAELVRYIELCEKGVPSLAAARQSFGSLADLEKQLAAYPFKFSLNYLRVETSIPGGKGSYPSQSLAPAQVKAYFGDFFARSGRPVEARAALQQSIALDPLLPAPYDTLAMMALRANDSAAALDWLNQAVAHGSQDYLTYYNHAILLLHREGQSDISRAAADLEEAVKLNPNYAEGYGLLAQLYADHDVKLNVASADVLRAIALKPASWRNHMTLGLVLLRQGKSDQAEAEAERALTLTDTADDRDKVEDFIVGIQQLRGDGSSPGQPSAAAASSAGLPPPALETRPEGPAANPAVVVLEGTARQVSCAGGAVGLSLEAYGASLPLFAPLASAVRYVDFPAPSPGSAPCSLLANRLVTVRYRPVPGKPYVGEILEIEWKR